MEYNVRERDSATSRHMSLSNEKSTNTIESFLFKKVQVIQKQIVRIIVLFLYRNYIGYASKFQKIWPQC